MENVGPVDDGTESLGDVPSLSEEVTGTDDPPPFPQTCTGGSNGSFISTNVCFLSCHLRGSCGVQAQRSFRRSGFV